MADDAVKYYEDGDHLPCAAEAGITGKHFVEISGDRQSGPGLSATAEGSNYLVSMVGTSGHRPLGVAAFTVTTGQKVTVIRQGVVPVAAGADLTAGTEVMSNASGEAIPLATGTAAGMCLADCDADVDIDAQILLYT